MLNRVLAVLCFLILSSPARATLVVYRWSPTEILIAADSLLLHVDVKPGTSTLSFTNTCKIRQHHDVFFAYVGFNVPDAAAEQAAQSGTGLAEIVSAFDIIAKAEIELEVRRETVKRFGEYFDRGGESNLALEVFAIDPRNHTLAHKIYRRAADGSTIHEPWKFYSPPASPAELSISGVHGAAYEVVKPAPNFSGLAFFNKFFMAQISHEQGLSRLGKYPAVGGPISILRIAEGKAGWVEGYRGACPAIER